MKRISWTIGIGKDKDGGSIAWCADKLIEQACAIVVDVFDGYTLTRHDGGWINGDGVLVTEPSITISTLAVEATGHGTAVKLKKLFNQESVLWTVEDLERCVFV